MSIPAATHSDGQRNAEDRRPSGSQSLADAGFPDVRVVDVLLEAAEAEDAVPDVFNAAETTGFAPHWPLVVGGDHLESRPTLDCLPFCGPGADEVERLRRRGRPRWSARLSSTQVVTPQTSPESLVAGPVGSNVENSM